MNGAFKSIGPNENLSPFAAFSFQGLSLPPDALPDSFLVTYTSGEEEMYHVGANLYSIADQVFYSPTNIKELVTTDPVFDEAGPPFTNFALAVLQALEIENVTSADVKPMKSVERKSRVPSRRAGVDTNKALYEFDQYFNAISAKTGEPIEVGGYKITDEYGVFKLTDFGFLADLDGDLAALTFWTNFTLAAKDKGVKKAIIDMSGNGGG